MQMLLCKAYLQKNNKLSRYISDTLLVNQTTKLGQIPLADKSIKVQLTQRPHVVKKMGDLFPGANKAINRVSIYIWEGERRQTFRDGA
jgi:hypothetical protein